MQMVMVTPMVEMFSSTNPRSGMILMATSSATTMVQMTTTVMTVRMNRVLHPEPTVQVAQSGIQMLMVMGFPIRQISVLTPLPVQPRIWSAVLT